jgi:hypothetical protein
MALLFAGEPCSGQSAPSDAIDGKSSQLPDPEKETVRGSIISGGDGCRRSSFHGPDRNSERGDSMASGLYAQRAARLLPPPPGGEVFPTPGTDAFQFR